MTWAERRWGDPTLFVKLIPVLILQSTAFFAPLLLTVLLTFQTTANYRMTWSWNFDTWAAVFGTPYYWSILLRTMAMAGLCAVICLLISLPVAYALATRLRRWNDVIKVMLIFVFLTDTTLKTFGWALFVDQKGAANFLLNFLGLGAPLDGFLFTEAATLLGMVYNFLPFSIFTIFMSVDAVDRSYVAAAYDAGAGKFCAFWHVTLPLSRPGIWAGMTLVFLLSVGAFLEPKMLGGGLSPMAAELIRQTFETRVNWPLGAALTLLLMVTSLIIVALFTRIYLRNDRGGR